MLNYQYRNSDSDVVSWAAAAHTSCKKTCSGYLWIFSVVVQSGLTAAHYVIDTKTECECGFCEAVSITLSLGNVQVTCVWERSDGAAVVVSQWRGHRCRDRRSSTYICYWCFIFLYAVLMQSHTLFLQPFFSWLESCFFDFPHLLWTCALFLIISSVLLYLYC